MSAKRCDQLLELEYDHRSLFLPGAVCGGPSLAAGLPYFAVTLY